MEDKGVDFPKLPPESEPPSANRSIVQSFLSRQSGVKSKSNSNIVPTELQWAAEDKMIMRTHEEHKCELPDVPRSTFLMVFSPDGKKVASTHGNHNVYVTDVTSGKNIKTLSGHPRTPWCIAFHPSSNQILASGCLGGQVRVWDLSGGSEIWMAESATVIASLAFHPVDRMLVIGTYNELHFWDWSQPEPFAKCFTSNQREKIRYVAFDPLGHKLITGIANAPTRAPSQWDRVAAPQPPPQNNQLDPWGERRITICYRYMVEQYEQLVQRYCDLSRARSTLTMDRGTDPMELEDDSSNSHRTAQNEAQARPPCRSCESQRTTAPLTSPSTSGNRVRFSLGTDETSASHSSTNFLTPPEASESDESSQSLPFHTPEETPSPNGTTNSFSRISNTPRRNPRFDITLPSFSSFRTRSSSVPPTNSTGAADSTSTCTPNLGDTSMTRTPSRVSLSRDSINFSNTRSDTQSNVSSPSEPVQNNSGGTTNNLRERLRNLMFTLRNRRNTEVNTVNSSVDSEFEEPEVNPEPRQASQSDTEEHRSVSNTGYDSTNNFNSPSRHSRNCRDNSSRRLSEAFSVSQLRSQFHRLQSVYENRNSNAPSAHVFSPETQTAERRLLNRINEILERPLPEPRARRLFVSRHSAFRPRVPQPPSRPAPQPPPDILRGVRYGIQLLSQHIDNMQRLCRARLEILQLQQIRRMWEDLQSQIYALHGAVRDSRDLGTGEEREASASTSQQPVRPTTSTTLPNRPTTSTSLPTRPTPNTDLLTDDDSDGPGSNGELHWRQRRTPQVSGRRNIPRTLQPRPANKYPPLKRSRLMLSKMNSNVKRMTLMQHVYARRQPQASSSTQEDGGDMSSSQVSGETSTGTSEERDTVRGLKRKSHDSDPLFSPRPSTASQGQSTSSAGSNSSSGICTNASADTTSSVNAGSSSIAGSSSNAGSSTNAGSGARNVSASNIAAVMRDTILQLENMVWRHRRGTSQRNPRFSRFTRQPEERRLRNLWDTESSHESSRDDQSEGESTQQSSPEQNTPAQNTQGNEPEGSEWSICNTRIRARQVLLLMVDSLTQFFENDNLTNRASNEALNDRINDLFVLLQLALNLTDLLLAQLFHSRRELDDIYRYRNRTITIAQEVMNNRRLRRMQDRYIRHTAMRRSIRRIMACPRLSLPSLILANSTPPTPASRRPPVASQAAPASRTLRSLHPHSNVRYPYHSPARPVVPVVRVNDLPAPPPENNIPRFRPHSPPPILPHPIVVPARFLHPGRYIGSGFVFDELSTSEDSSPQERNGDFFFMRGGYGSSSVILTDTPMSPQHRIQAWDFSEYKLPDLESAEKNIVVTETKIHNDASVDVSRDGRLLVALLPSGRVSMTTLLGIYSLQWDTLGQLLYTTSFEQSIVSVSLSPTARHLVVGLASRRVTLVSSDRLTYAQVFRLEGATPGRRAPLGARGRLVHLRDLDLSRHFGFMSLNCIRWAPNPGQGLVYGTNTGQLKILR